MPPQPRQTTLARVVSTDGIGLHSGVRCSLTLQPAASDTGFVFIHSSGLRIPAIATSVVDTRRCTTLGLANTRISTVEHLLSALYGMGVDNAEILLTGEEVPAADGSAQPWVELIRSAGVTRLPAPRRELSLSVAVWAGDGDSWAVATPSPHLALCVGVDYGDAIVGRQTLSLTVTPAVYARELAPARTFCFQHEIEALLAAGLAKGGTEENAVVVHEDGYSLPLRYPDEPVRHKAMDLLGDLALYGVRLRAQVTAIRPSHRVNVALAQALSEQFGR